MEPPDIENPPIPPEDPDNWTNEQWMAWLKATDAAANAEQNAQPATAGSRLVRMPAAHALGQAMIGMARVIYGQRENKAVIVVEANSEPEEDQPFTLHLNVDHPEETYLVMRPEENRPD